MDNYPVGSNTPDAPWNQTKDQKPINVDCYISCSLSKEVSIPTRDYIKEEYQHSEHDDEGNVYTVDTYDYSNCNFHYDYHKSHFSIPELLKHFEVLLEKTIDYLECNPIPYAYSDKNSTKTTVKMYKRMLEDCKGWTLDEEEVGEL